MYVAPENRNKNYADTTGKAYKCTWNDKFAECCSRVILVLFEMPIYPHGIKIKYLSLHGLYIMLISIEKLRKMNKMTQSDINMTSSDV